MLFSWSGVIKSLQPFTKVIEKAIKTASNLSEIWLKGNLHQKKKTQNLVFPSGLGYNKSNSEVQTFKTNSIFASTSLLSGILLKEKSGKPVDFNQLSALVTPPGFKPGTSTAVM